MKRTYPSILFITLLFCFGFTPNARGTSWSEEITRVYQSLPPVVVLGNPIAPLPANVAKGEGLCAQLHALNSPSESVNLNNFVPALFVNDFNQETPPENFFKECGKFMDNTYQYVGQWTAYKTIGYPFDSQNGFGLYPEPDPLKRGEFDPSDIPGCPARGCLFTGYDIAQPATLRSFGYQTNPRYESAQFMSRYRGLLRVTPERVGKPIHFGLFGSFATGFGMRLWDKEGNVYHVIRRRSILTGINFHASNQVIFQKPGLYEVEIDYLAYGAINWFEGSFLIGPFQDIETHEMINCVTNPDCDHPNFRKDWGFELLPSAWFQQSTNGQHPYVNVDQCQQCVFEQKEAPGNGSCGPGYYCAAGGICDKCNASTHCGSDCITCPKEKSVCSIDPVTGKGQCLECQGDKDCKSGKKCLVAENRCQECLQDADCPQGKVCDGSFRCVSCGTADSCASASCGCCPGQAPLCENLSQEPGNPKFTCIECTSDAQCVGKGICDLNNHRCVDKIPECNTSTACGNTCEPCQSDSDPKKNRPYCLHGQVCVQCRNDLDCGGTGTYCLSGDCVACISDKRCGSTCHPCGGDKPYCLARGSVESAVCVECMDDSQCGPEGRCDVVSHTCQNKCQRDTACGKGTYCMGKECVECYADSQCCGGVCDLVNHTCQGGCNDTGDCMGDECCNTTSGQCEQRRCKSNVTAHGGALCCSLPAGGEPPLDSLHPSWVPVAFLAGLLALAAVAFLWQRQRRKFNGVD